jgi:hypothetical protein
MSTKTKAAKVVVAGSPRGAVLVALVTCWQKTGEQSFAPMPVAVPGETCERVAASSLPYLEAHDPRQVIAKDVFEACTPEQQQFLIGAAIANRPYQRTSRGLAGWIDPDHPDRAWLIERGLVPPKE